MHHLIKENQFKHYKANKKYWYMYHISIHVPVFILYGGIQPNHSTIFTRHTPNKT